MTKLILNITLIIIVAIFTNGCSQNTTKETPNSKPLLSDKKEQTYVSTVLGIHNDKFYDSKKDLFKIKKNSKFSPEIKLGNNYPHSNQYRLLFFVDYKQISIEYNKQQKKFLDVTMKMNSEKKLKVTLKDLTEGQHDFMVLSIGNPNSHVNKTQFIPGEEVYLNNTRRIIVGNGILKEPNFTKLDSKNDVPQASLFITENKEGVYERQYKVLRKKDLQNFWLHIPVEKSKSRLVLIAIAGTNQLNIKTPYIEIENKGTASIPLKDIQNIHALNTPENLTILAIKDAYSNLNTNPIYTNKITIAD
jgi:hypothetical protein